MLGYLATPYSRYALGLDVAWRDACILSARLILSGVNVYSPIAHGHGIAIHGDIDPLDQRFWTEFDGVMLKVCDVLIVAHMAGWEESSGVAHEIGVFERAGKPIFDCYPATLTMVRRK